MLKRKKNPFFHWIALTTLSRIHWQNLRACFCQVFSHRSTHLSLCQYSPFPPQSLQSQLLERKHLLHSHQLQSCLWITITLFLTDLHWDTWDTERLNLKILKLQIQHFHFTDKECQAYWNCFSNLKSFRPLLGQKHDISLGITFIMESPESSL